MNITINGTQQSFSGTLLSELIEQQQPEHPFAIAVNTQFVPKSKYQHTVLNENDSIEIVRPVVGG